MKDYFFILITVLTLISTSSCKKREVCGNCDGGFKASISHTKLYARAGTIDITVTNDWWWVSTIKFNNNYVDFSNIETEHSTFVIDKADFKIERKSGTKIVIEMNENTTNQPRVLEVQLESGDCFYQFTITQLDHN